jgi:tetratricopeptide (TPR) repeat protein
VGLSPRWKTAHNNIGDAYRNLSKFDLALAAYNETLAIDAKDGEAIYGIGQIYVRQGRMPQAREQKAKLDQLAPDLAARLLAKMNAAAAVKRPAAKR